MSTRTDVAIYLPSLGGGGAERVTVLLANEFAARGLTVDLVVSSEEGPYREQISKEVRLINLQAGRVLASLPALIRYLKNKKPRAILSALNHANITVLLACMLARVTSRVVVAEHSTPSSAAVQHRALTAAVLRILMRLTYPKADQIVAVSGGVSADLIRFLNLPEKKVKIIYNPVIFPAIFEMSRQAVLDPWLEKEDSPVILAVGRLTRAKDFPNLVEAFALVRKEFPCRLAILGEGELRFELEELIRNLGLKESAHMPGFVKNPYAWMRRASIFVLSSAWEGLPTVLIEAMACGTPVVSTDCPSGPREILADGMFGTLVPVASPVQLSHAILSTLKQQQMENSFEHLSKFHVKHASERYLELLLESH